MYSYVVKIEEEKKSIKVGILIALEPPNEEWRKIQAPSNLFILLILLLNEPSNDVQDYLQNYF